MPSRDSGLEDESTPVSRDSTRNLSSIDLIVKFRRPTVASGREQTSKSDNLTLSLEGLQAALESRRQTVGPTRKELGQAPRHCESVAEDRISRESGRSDSDDIFTAAAAGANTLG